MARHITRRGNGIPDMKLMHPYREWFLGLGIVIVIVIAGALYNAFSFRYYSTLEGRVVGGSAEVVEYQRGTVDRVLEAYRTRKATFDTLRTSIVSTVPVRAKEDADVQQSGALRVE